MEDIMFKMKDNHLVVEVCDEIRNDCFLKRFKEKLLTVNVFKSDVYKNVVLNLKDRVLSDREIVELFDILEETKTFYLSKIIYKNRAREKISIYKGNIRGGQVRFFATSLLLVGSINPSSKLIVFGDLYVLGKIEGCVELKDENGKIYCEYLTNSVIKIGNVYKVYDEEIYGRVLYLEDGVIKDMEYVKEEFKNVKSGSCYFG